MRLTPTAAVVPFLLVLLSWLSLRAVDPEAERYDRALKGLDRFTMVETGLQRDVLSARAGILRDYDPLVQKVNSLRETLGLLHDNVSDDPTEVVAIDRLATEAARQEELTERFKTANALLQNSLAYFPLLSARLAESDGGSPLAAAVSRLAAAMLKLTLDTSPAAARDVADRLNALAAQPAAADEAASVQALLAHGRLLHDLLPKTDGVLRGLLAAPSKRELNALRMMILAHQKTSRRTARGFRLLLYVISLVLLGVLVQFGRQLRGRAITLRRRAALEHAIAGISTRLIDAKPGDLEAHIERALAELAELVGADRAYLAMPGMLTGMQRWCSPGASYPPGWPDRAPALAARLDATREGITDIRSVDRLPPGADKDMLVATGLHGWVFVSKLYKGGPAILGFDLLRPGRITQSAELGLLRMALDGVANAIAREHLEQERARLEANLQRARRMETVGALASGIAHNFNNIVGAILGYTETAEGQLGSDSRPARSLAEIRRAGERARDLIDQILAFGRPREADRRPVSLKELFAETRSLLHASLPSQIELMIREAPEAAVISGNPGQLQQVMLNLCNNAAQAMDQAGRIEVETELREISEARAFTHGDLAPGRYVRIVVSDRGRGMDETTLRRIFEPFFTTRFAGNGLGLATVREIVREHGGAMNISSTPGAGSRFEVWLPCSTMGGVMVTAAPDRLNNLSLGRGETVLMVDAVSERLLADEEMLAAIGYEPVGFTRAVDALAACRARPERFDAGVVGHLASANSALDLAGALHEIAPGLPIVIATASAENIGADTLLAAGISEVVHRPLISAEIASALARCLTVPTISTSELQS
jgi:signal transduction histidine kinase/CheY-like chemotaxis protein